MTYTLEFPWPPSDLSPNARGHWVKRHRAAKRYRADAKVITLEATGGRLDPSAPRLRIVFHPPDKRGRDLDNLVASFKAGQDGICDALRVNDVDAHVSWEIGDVRPKGRVVVALDA